MGFLMKKLIICCDGTWQTLETEYPTNVCKIAQSIDSSDRKGISQVVYYDEGIGTFDRLDRLTGGAFGWGIDRKIKEIYTFLSFNYFEGDEIYLFGFSRGAYTVRSLAGMIYNVGLLNKLSVREIDEVYEFYRDRSEETAPSSSSAIRLRSNLNSKQVNINVLGCWDTVGSLGVPNKIPLLPFDDWINEKYRFHDTFLNQKIERAFHAVAVDELRQVFNVTPMQPDPNRPGQVKQVWFPGGHGAVGGGTQAEAGLSDAALKWMIEEVRQVSELEFNREFIENNIHPNHQISFNDEPGFFDTFGQQERKITSNFEDLHISTKRRWCDVLSYRPQNLKEKFELELDSFCQSLSSNL
jgi:uncharacterized protein (DUF2235 family)